jgi:hypothetical protein
MTGKDAYVSSAVLFALAAAGLAATPLLERRIGPTELHGPIGIIVAVPCCLAFAVGAAILAWRVVAARLSFGQTLAGVAPLLALILGAAAFALVVVAR